MALESCTVLSHASTASGLHSFVSHISRSGLHSIVSPLDRLWTRINILIRGVTRILITLAKMEILATPYQTRSNLLYMWRCTQSLPPEFRDVACSRDDGGQCRLPRLSGYCSRRYLKERLTLCGVCLLVFYSMEVKSYSTVIIHRLKRAPHNVNTSSSPNAVCTV
jgi:hypothetical protein